LKELEVKVLNIDIEEMEMKILSLGGILIAKEFQTNYIIDSTLKPIKSYTDAYLRIRETKDLLNNTTTNTLTLKKNIPNEHLRENIELNVDIDNKEVLMDIFKELQFDTISTGHKKRNSYELMDSRIDIDIWDEEMYPYPYMEIEVEDEKSLDNIIKALNIQKDNISKESIMQLKEKLNSK